MPKEFETHGEAREYCERFGLRPHPMKTFEMARALNRAYEEGKTSKAVS